MKSTDLSAAQLARLKRGVSRCESYLSRLTGRMAQKHFPHDDRLKRAAEHAYAGVAALAHELERLAVGCGKR